ncbi:MAG: GldG family protein [Candidatus Aminicenantales bacterium]
METVKKHLNTIGLALLFLSFTATQIWPYQKFYALILAVLGLVSIGLYIYFNLSLLKQGLKRKSFIYSSNLLLVIVLVLAILVVVNYFFSKHHHRFDFTETKLHSLSDQSIKVAENLKDDVRIHCFFREGNLSRSKMENLLKIYAYHSKKIKSEFIDPDKNPGLIKRYEITQDGTTIFESGDKENRITSTTEEDVTNAVIKISREKKKIIYFLEGHGEHSIEESDEDSYSSVKDELQKLGYEVKKLSLALSDHFPKDCALLVIPGPEKDLVPNELETIKTYVEEGGRVFFMIDPESAPGLTGYLEDFGIRLANDLIVDPVSRLMGGDYFMPIIGEYEYHEITKGFRYATFFPYTRSVDVLEGKPDGITAQVLGKTSANSWSERQLEEKKVTFDKDKDKAGPIPLAVVATVKPKKTDQPESGESKEAGEKEGRIAVFGDSDFASNRYYNLSGNGNFFLNTVNWLTEEADLISIQAKTSNPRTIQLTPAQGRIIFFTSVIILPAAVLVFGISIWIRRRSL